MQPESQFVYDWLKSQIEIRELTKIAIWGWTYVSSLDHGSRCEFGFLVYNNKLKDHILYLDVPITTQKKHVLRALLELHDHGLINNLPSSFEVAESLCVEDVYGKLRSQT